MVDLGCWEWIIRGGRRTVTDLVFGDFALLFDVEAADVEVPFALEAGGRGDADFCGWGWWEAFDACYAHDVFADLFHADVGDVGGDVAIVVERALDLV